MSWLFMYGFNIAHDLPTMRMDDLSTISHACKVDRATSLHCGLEGRVKRPCVLRNPAPFPLPRSSLRVGAYSPCS